jgi:hypothetical protein
LTDRELEFCESAEEGLVVEVRESGRLGIHRFRNARDWGRIPGVSVGEKVSFLLARAKAHPFFASLASPFLYGGDASPLPSTNGNVSMEIFDHSFDSIMS